MHKPIGDEADYAESWELSDYHDSVSVVQEGSLAGTTLRQLVQTRGQELLGPAVVARDQFPLLVKFIDAHQVLSVQVHPDDETGRRLAGDNGKTETWVILDAEPGSLIYAGLKQGVGEAELAEAIQSKTVEHLLHRFEPKPGDSILIEAGTVHAIGAGVLLAEIQEMSDATFRIDDWGRLGDDGKPRPLHIRQSMESIDFSRGPVDPIRPEVEPIDGGGTRERLTTVAVLCPRAAQTQAGDVRGTGRSVHDPHGPGGLLRRRASRRKRPSRLRSDAVAAGRSGTLPGLTTRRRHRANLRGAMKTGDLMLKRHGPTNATEDVVVDDDSSGDGRPLDPTFPRSATDPGHRTGV